MTSIKLPPEIRALIETGPPAHLITIGRDGGPHVTLVWIGADGEELVVGHVLKSQKVKNALRDPRVAVSVLGGVNKTSGLREYAVLYGRARIEEGGGPELLQRLARVYLGPDAIYPDMENLLPGYVTRIRVERITGVGPWTRPSGEGTQAGSSEYSG